MMRWKPDLRAPRVDRHVPHRPLVPAVHPRRRRAAIRAGHRRQLRSRSYQDPVAGVLNLLDHQRCQPAEHHTY